jgi:hypothetical protein
MCLGPIFLLLSADCVFGRFDLAALRGCHISNVCLFVCKIASNVEEATEAQA